MNKKTLNPSVFFGWNEWTRECASEQGESPARSCEADAAPTYINLARQVDAKM